MRKILLAMALLLSAAACGSSPTGASAADAQASLDGTAGPPVVCSRYALSGGNRICVDPE